MNMKNQLIKLIVGFLNTNRGYSWTNLSSNSVLLFKKRIARYTRIIQIAPYIRFTWFWHNDIQEIQQAPETDLLRYFNEFDDDSKFIFSKLLYFSGRYCNELCKLLLQFAKETQKMEYRYWTTMDISRFTFRQQKGFYAEYYRDRRELLQMICNDMQLTIPKKRGISDNKLCIVTHLLDGSLNNSVQRVATMFAKGLGKEFDEIAVFPMDVFSPGAGEKKTLTTVLTCMPSFLSNEKIESLFPAGVKVHYPEGCNYMEKAQNVLNAIYEYNPQLILDISDEYSAISYYYAKDFCTVYLPLRSSNSSSCFTYMLESRWKIDAAYKNDKYAGEVKNIEWSFPEYIPPMNGRKSKSDLNYSEEDFVVVCSGNNATMCSEEFVDEIARLLANNSRIKLLFVGQGAPVLFHERYPSLFESRKVREWGFEKDLFGLYCACDVLVRPNMTGGSGATAIAAMAGLPIAMTDFICDPNRWLGLDFSPFHTYAQVMDYILQLSEDQELYRANVEKCKTLVNKAADSPEKWKSLGDLLKNTGE